MNIDQGFPNSCPRDPSQLSAANCLENRSMSSMSQADSGVSLPAVPSRTSSSFASQSLRNSNHTISSSTSNHKNFYVLESTSPMPDSARTFSQSAEQGTEGRSIQVQVRWVIKHRRSDMCMAAHQHHTRKLLRVVVVVMVRQVKTLLSAMTLPLPSKHHKTLGQKTCPAA